MHSKHIENRIILSNQKSTLLVVLLTVFASFGFVIPTQHQIQKPEQTELLFSQKSKKQDKKTWTKAFFLEKEADGFTVSFSSLTHSRLSSVAFIQNQTAIKTWRFPLKYQAPTKIPSLVDSPLL